MNVCYPELLNDSTGHRWLEMNQDVIRAWSGGREGRGMFGGSTFLVLNGNVKRNLFHRQLCTLAGDPSPLPSHPRMLGMTRPRRSPRDCSGSLEAPGGREGRWDLPHMLLMNLSNSSDRFRRAKCCGPTSFSGFRQRASSSGRRPGTCPRPPGFRRATCAPRAASRNRAPDSTPSSHSPRPK